MCRKMCLNLGPTVNIAGVRWLSHDYWGTEGDIIAGRGRRATGASVTHCYINENEEYHTTILLLSPRLVNCGIPQKR